MNLNLTAPPNQTSYGLVTTSLLAGLRSQGVDVALFPIGEANPEPRHADVVGKAIAKSRRYDASAPSLRIWHQWELAHHAGWGPRAGYSFWEVDRLTDDEVHQFNQLDIAFVPSEWAYVVARESGVKVNMEVLTPGVDTDVFSVDVKPAVIPKTGPETTVFLNVGKWEVRKGHDFLLAAFNAAFSPADDVMLVTLNFNQLQFPGYNGPAESARWNEIYDQSPMGQAGKIVHVKGRVQTQQDVAMVMAAADCGFFPSRAEGWNMPLAEMLAMGKAAIATDYSAHIQFAERAGARMIETDGLEEAYDGFFFRGFGQWAKLGERALEQAVLHLRAVHATKQEYGSLSSNKDGISLFKEHLTWTNAARVVCSTLHLRTPSAVGGPGIGIRTSAISSGNP